MHNVIYIKCRFYYRNLVIFRIENISYVIISCSFNFVPAPDIIYETRVKVSLLKNVRAFNFRTDGSVRNYEIKPNYGISQYFILRSIFNLQSADKCDS